MRNLIEKIRAEIAAESRPVYSDEFCCEMQKDMDEDMQEEMQANFDAKLTPEKGKSEEEKGRMKGRTDRSASEATPRIESMKVRLRTMKRDLRASFSEGEEEGEKNANAEHAARWKSTDEQLGDKAKQLQIRERKLDQEKMQLEGLVGGQSNVLTAETAAQAQKIADQAQEIDRLSREGTACAEESKSQLSEKDEKIKRGQAEVASYAGGLQQQLVAKNQETNRLQNQLGSELLNHQEAMGASVRKQTRGEQELTRSHSKKMRKQYNPSSASVDMGDDVSGLTDKTSTVQPEMEDRAIEPANSADGQHGQMLADQQSNNEQLHLDLARKDASNEILPQSLAECQARKENQPPVEDFGDCEARLHELQAYLEQKHARESERQAAWMTDRFRKDAEAYLADKNAELARTKAKASEESRRLQIALSTLEKDMEASYAEIMWHQRVSQETRQTIQSLRHREKELSEDKKRLFRTTKELEASLSQKDKDCRGWSGKVKVLKVSLERADRTMELFSTEVEETAQAKRAAEAETRSLRAANRALVFEKRELEAMSSFAIAELNAVFAELDRCQMQSEHLTAELWRVCVRPAERETTIKKEADEPEGTVDWLLEEWGTRWEEPVLKEAEKEETQMDALLGVPEMVKEDFLRPQSPRGKDLVFWLLVGLFLLLSSGLLVVAFSAASAANRERQLWDEVTRLAVVSLRTGGGPELLWHDPLLDLSRGMYGV